jgi:hypothetical protein
MKLIVLLIYVVICIFIISRNSCTLVGQIYFLTTLGHFLVRMGGIYCDIFGVSSDTRRQLSRNNGSRRNNGLVQRYKNVNESITIDTAM